MGRAATLLTKLRLPMPTSLPSIPSLPPKPTFSAAPVARALPPALPVIHGLPPKPQVAPVPVRRHRSPSPIYSRRDPSPRRRSPSPRRRSPSPRRRERSPRRRSPIRRSARSRSPYARFESSRPTPARYRRSPSPRREPSPSRSLRSYSSKPLASRINVAAFSTDRGRSYNQSPSASPPPSRKHPRTPSPPTQSKKVVDTQATPASPIPASSRTMPSRGRGRGRGGSGGSSRPALAALPPPLHSQDQIKQLHSDDGRIELKQQWSENPKAPLANYAGQGGGATNFGEGGSAYQTTEGLVNGQKVFR